MNPEEQLRRLRDEARWDDAPFILREGRRRAWVPRVAAGASGLAALAAGLMLLGVLQFPVPTSSPTAVATAAVPWSAERAPAPEASARALHLAAVPLTAALAAPASAAAGATLEYTVTLTNPTSRAVPLTPCPAYTQSLVAPRSGGGAGRALVGGRYLLNCAAVRSLAPGASATFAMRAPLAAGVTGDVQLRWALAGGPTATTRLALQG
jgi:hypothetical protein